MPPKQRNKQNRGLPMRWRHRYGSYYYLVPPGQEDRWDGKREFKLGRTLTEAYKTWAERMESLEPVITVAQLADRYLLARILHEQF